MRSRRREGLGFPQDLVTFVARHHGERRDLDVRWVAADGFAVPTKHLDFVCDRLRIADEVAGVGVGRNDPKRLAFSAAADQHPRPGRTNWPRGAQGLGQMVVPALVW